MIIDESVLDQLEVLKSKRLAEITTKGEDFSFSGSEKLFKGITDRQKSTVTFQAGTPVHPGAILEGKTGQLYVANIEQKAGVVVADALPIIGSIDTLTAKSTNTGTVYSRSGSIPLLTRSAGELGIPAHRTLPTGAPIKHAGQLLTVTGARREGPVTVLRVQPVQAEKAITRQAYDAGRDALSRIPIRTAPVRGLSAYN